MLFIGKGYQRACTAQESKYKEFKKCIKTEVLPEIFFIVIEYLSRQRRTSKPPPFHLSPPPLRQKSLHTIFWFFRQVNTA
jgi:hypothetical protein